jgi:hypothetical protein
MFTVMLFAVWFHVETRIYTGRKGLELIPTKTPVVRHE